ncbi:MAG: hypothetical protein ACOH2V_14050 [Candidatus Saccharimonadaceae bacterium]
MKKFIVQRELEWLKKLPIYYRNKGGPDKTIVVKAMVDYIKFSNSQPGMPVLVDENNIEFLQDGLKLIEAYNKSDFHPKIACIWNCTISKNPSSPFMNYSIKEAEKIGSEARLITFETEINDLEMAVFNKKWILPPDKVNNYSIGWDEIKSNQLPGWLYWINEVKYISQYIKKVIAVNGRFFGL